MKKLLRSIVESEVWFWNWEMRYSVSDNLRPNNNYIVFQHKYTGRIIRKRLK